MIMVVFLGIGGLYAMQPPSGGGGLPGGPTDKPAAPIDGGIVALIVLGSTYGVKKYKKLN